VPSPEERTAPIRAPATPSPLSQGVGGVGSKIQGEVWIDELQFHQQRRTVGCCDQIHPGVHGKPAKSVLHRPDEPFAAPGAIMVGADWQMLIKTDATPQTNSGAVVLGLRTVGREGLSHER
jgi:hypothetical protein